MSAKRSVGLMGGLGNQLFQLAFALNIPSATPIQLVPILKNVRRNVLREPEIMSLVLPPGIEVRIDERFLNPVTTKLLSYGLRVTSSDSSSIKVSIATRIASLSHLLLKDEVKFATGLGSGDSIYSPDHDLIHVGYYQAYSFSESEDVFSDLMSLKPRMPSDLLTKLALKASREEAIMLHVRLTDYLTSPGFGIPTCDYYRAGISHLFDSLGERPIWVFSDDIALARDFLPSEFSSYFYFPEPLPNSVLNWELMRHFYGYVIANSSYSWWAARLRRDGDSPVVVPWPWFIEGGPTQDELVPHGWNTFKRD